MKNNTLYLEQIMELANLLEGRLVTPPDGDHQGVYMFITAKRDLYVIKPDESSPLDDEDILWKIQKLKLGGDGKPIKALKVAETIASKILDIIYSKNTAGPLLN